VETTDFSAETLNQVLTLTLTLTTLTLTLTLILTQALHPSPSCNVMQTLTPEFRVQSLFEPTNGKPTKLAL
jgi:hypothetical protein